MALILTRDNTHAAEYVGRIGARVQLKVLSASLQATFIAGAYGRDILTVPSFTITSGIKTLVVVIENATANDWTAVYEEDPGSAAEQMLRKQFKFDPKWPAVAFVIRGA